ncbi:MAG: hypothetical protein KF752_18190 [Pirellulaceae bacterium]|nr:hypothetical protein [Pirellulaceae bacterium]
MVTTFQIFVDLLRLLLSPGTFVFGLYELWISWLRTRSWWNAMFAIPLIAVLAFMLIHSSLIPWVGSDNQLETYWNLVESEMAANQLAPETSSPAVAEVRSGPGGKSFTLVHDEHVTPFAMLLLRRIFQISNSNDRAIYLVATALGQQGRAGQARQLMRRIAPLGARGFAGAHAWLAADQIQTKAVSNNKERNELLHDLEAARAWPNVTPALMNVYADLLERDGRVTEALAILGDLSSSDPMAKVRIAQIAKRNGREEEYLTVRQQLLDDNRQKFQQGTATDQDYVQLVSLLLVGEDDERAIRLATEGLSEYKEDPQLKRLLSDAYLLRFEKTKKVTEERYEVDLTLLDMALTADSTNPVLQEKIAELVALRRITNDKLVGHLREQIAAGRATAISHLLMGISNIRQSQFQQAIVHLEVAVSLSPNNPYILNNLALCLARHQPGQLARAKQLIETAIQVGGPDAERLDTYGEILASSGDSVAAIRALESSIAMQPNRPQTRKKLATEYLKLHMPDMAAAVLAWKPSPPMAQPNSSAATPTVSEATEPK